MAALAVPLITAGLSGLAGLFGGKPKETKTTSDQTTNQQSSQSASSNPNFNPFQQKLMELFSQQAQQMGGNPNLGGYAQQGLQQIGQQGNLNRQVIGNSLAARGLSYSPAAQAPFTQNLMNTGAQQNQFLAQLPLLQRQFQQQGFQNLLSAFGAIPTGQSSTSSGTSSGTSHGTQVGEQSGNPMAGLMGGLGAGITAGFPQLFGGQQQDSKMGPTSSWGQPVNYGPYMTPEYDAYGAPVTRR